MHLLTYAILIAACTFQIISISGSVVSKDFNFRMCTNNESINMKVLTTKDPKLENSATCQCNVEPLVNSLKIRDDYEYTPGIGAHKLHTNAKTWNEARKICNEEGGYLAIINSMSEEEILLDMLRRNAYKIKNALNKDEVLLGIHDMFREGEWLTVFGDAIGSTGYANWSPTYAGGQPDNFGGSQNCGALVSVTGMDDVSCVDRFAFFCEMPVTC